MISICVINLSAQKKNVFSEIFQVLKPGGELLSTSSPGAAFLLSCRATQS